MSKKNNETPSNTNEGNHTAQGRAVQPRTGRAKQLRRLREKSVLVRRTALTAEAVKAGEPAKTPKQGRLRQLKGVKQHGAKLTRLAGATTLVEKLGLARPMQMRQFAARKSIKVAPTSVQLSGGVVSDKTSLARTAQGRQLAAKKQVSKKAVTAT